MFFKNRVSWPLQESRLFISLSEARFCLRSISICFMLKFCARSAILNMIFDSDLIENFSQQKYSTKPDTMVVVQRAKFCLYQFFSNAPFPYPLKNIWKSYSFLMFLESKERVHWELYYMLCILSFDLAYT